MLALAKHLVSQSKPQHPCSENREHIIVFQECGKYDGYWEFGLSLVPLTMISLLWQVKCGQHVCS